MVIPLQPLPQSDLEHILQHTSDLWAELRGQHLFITGGSGFIGTWLLESLVWANQRLGLRCEATALSRDPRSWQRRLPHVTGAPGLHLLEGDVRAFAVPSAPFSHVIHAATDTAVSCDPLERLESIVLGTRRVLELARERGARRFLLLSSGAVYGRQPTDLERVSEQFCGAPDPAASGSAYGEGKRVAELLCTLYADRFGLDATVARCFAFVGPHLPLEAHFAIGNFIGDGLRGAPVRVKGDGTPYRSYLHAADLAIWLWTILMRGAPARPYNVGSDDGLTIAKLAERVAGRFGVPVEVATAPTPGQPAERYVPATERARTELGLRQWIGLDEAIARTAAWHRVTARQAEPGESPVGIGQP